MRTILRITVLTMVVAAFTPLATGTAEPPPGGTFVDDDLSIHQGSIEAIAAAGITRGCNPPADTWFCPNDAVTRGQMAAFLVRALSLPPAEPGVFTDISDTQFADDIYRIAAAGITRGCNPPDNDRYCPDWPVKRSEMAAFLTRALQLSRYETDSFVDDEGNVFEADIESLRGAGITAGCNPPDNNRYCPDRAVSRAEMATFLTRALGLAEQQVPDRPYAIDVVDRQSWGAAAPRGAFSTHEIEQITIHHAGNLDGPTGAAQFRSWQSWHQFLGWPDLAYHFIVGRDGKVYEGRPYGAVGDTATEYDPSGHLLIVMEGNFEHDVPTTTQLEMTAQLIAWASLHFDVPASTVSGHRDHAATDCPGEALYSHIADGSLALRANEILDAGGVTLQLPDL